MRLDTFITENTITESINDKGIFKACFFAGSPGSGKSYTLSKITDGAIAPRIVNVDKWVEHFNTGYEEDELAKPKVLVKAEVYNYVNSLLPLFVDTTSISTHAVVKRRSLLEKIGYDTAIIYVNTSLDMAIDRVEKRNAEGGRQVSIDVVKEYYEKSVKIKKFLKHAFYLYMEVNNDTGTLTDDVLMKAYNRMSFFYNSAVSNKIGIETINTMKENKWKYLTDGVYSETELDAKISSWFRST